jgi:hypothetical protein
MQFGESLARMVVDIAAGYDARKVSAGNRASALSALSAATQRMVSAHTAHRKVVASHLAAGAAELRRNLAQADATLDAQVRQSRAAARQDLAAKRAAIAANAKTLHADLDRSRRDASAAVTAFRSDVRSDQAANAQALAASLDHFVAGIRSGTAQIQQAVQAQLSTARTAWGKGGARRPNASVD